MPFGEEGVDEKQVGLALSGGGFRASLFHLGALWRFNELGWLRRLTRISSVSGGSITAGVLGVHWRDLRWDDKNVALNFRDVVAEPLQSFCARNIDVWDVLSGALSPFERASDKLTESYDEYLFKGRTLQDLPDENATDATRGPRFTFNSTNLQTGKDFRFCRPYAGDYIIGLIKQPLIPVAIAVAASSAFPPVLSPLVYKPRQAFEAPAGSTPPPLFGRKDYTEKLYLSDGGLYDNLGHETIYKRCRTVFVCDAGAPPKTLDDITRGNIKELRRVLDVAMDQARALRIRWLLDDYDNKRRIGKLWTISTDPRDYGLADSLPCRPGKRAELAAMRTRLNKFDPREQGELINLGYALADAALRSHAGAGAGPAPRWPFDKYPL